MVGSGSQGRLKGGLGRAGAWGEAGVHVCICGPTTQVPTSVHFWADAHGCRDREGELERREGRGGEGRWTSSIYSLIIQAKEGTTLEWSGDKWRAGHKKIQPRVLSCFFSITHTTGIK